MSPIRHRHLTVEEEPYLAARSMASNLTNGYIIETHTHPWHQLLCACTGAMTVYGGRFSWIIPPGKAVFIPAGTTHSIRMWGDVAMRSLYFPTTLNAPAVAGDQCRVLSMTPLLRELVLRIIEIRALDARTPNHQRLLGVLLDEMNLAPEAPLVLPLPVDARALAVARHILSDPPCAASLDHLAHRYGASRRTLERLFRQETGLSFGLWRQKVRLLDAIRVLAQGKSVTEAALDTGYASLSAFIAAFKKTFGYTPSRI